MNRAAFLDAIRQEPDEMSHRLVFADWLDDHGDEARAEFIRLQVGRHGLPPAHPVVRRALPREEELLAAHRAEWTAFVPGGLRWPRFRRGFAEEFILEPRPFLAHGEALFQATPFTRLRLRYSHGGGVIDWPRLPALLRRLPCLDLERFYAAVPAGVLGNLRELRVRTDGAALRNLLQQQGLFDDLRSLALVSPAAAGEPAANALHACKPDKLEELSMSGSLPRHLFRSPLLARLRSLSVSHCGLVPADIRDLGAAGELPRLERLDLSFNPIGLDGVFGLGANMPALKWLNLSHTGLGDGGASAIARSGLLSRLHGIDLSLCRIGERGGMALATLTEAPSLLTLDLIYNDLGTQARAAIAERFGVEACLFHR